MANSDSFRRAGGYRQAAKALLAEFVQAREHGEIARLGSTLRLIASRSVTRDLKQALGSFGPYQLEEAVCILGNLYDHRANDAFRRLWADPRQPSAVRCECLEALGKSLAKKRRFDELERVMEAASRDPDAEVSKSAACVLTYAPWSPGLNLIAESMSQDHRVTSTGVVGETALLALANWRSENR